jgi:hypothetical protein
MSPCAIIGEECEPVGWMERLALPSIPPQTGVDPPEGALARESILLEPGEVSVQHVASCHIARPIASSLSTGALGWVRWKQGRSSMKRFSYRERDYAFGERMLTLRHWADASESGRTPGRLTQRGQQVGGRRELSQPRLAQSAADPG